TGSKQINDNNDKWGEAGDPARNAAAVDAHYGAAMTYDYYKNMFGRNSIDGNGEKLVSNVHINQNYVNAYWDGNQMNYGDGDGPNGDALRYMDDPTKDGYSIDNYSKYAASDKEVHRTSGIANNAFALLVKGGTNKTSGTQVNGGIGPDKALQIFFRANTVYMT